MWSSRPSLKRFLWAAALGAWLVVHTAGAQEMIILHLRNGDRIAGVITSENTNQVVVSNVWSTSLVIPLAQIERRESPTHTPPAVATAATPATTPAAGTNAAPLTPMQTWLKRWKGEISVGSDLLYAATDQQIYHGRVSLTYAQPYQRDPKEFFRNILTYTAEYGKTDGVLSANRMDGSSKTDLDLTPRIYLYNLGRAGYDEIQKINLGFEEGPGAGYHFLKLTNFVMNLELGANYQVQDRSDGTTTKDFYYRMAEDYTWKINKVMNMTEKFEFFPRADNFGQYRARLESTLSYTLMANLCLNLTVLNMYDTQPAAGVPRNELQLRTSLGYKF